MRIAALYDVHGNLPALEAVLADVRRTRVDAVVVGGDVVPGPCAGEALDTLLGLDEPTYFLRGNGEREVLAMLDGGAGGSLPEAVKESLRWVGAQLADHQVRTIREWPESFATSLPSLGDVLFCHATPRDDSEIFTRLTPEEAVGPAFAGCDASVVVCGHTHIPFDRRIGRFRVVNAGSVGMSFAGAGAFWLLLDETVELQRVDYDVVAAAERLSATGYPDVEDFVARYVLASPTESQMTPLLERSAMGATAT